MAEYRVIRDFIDLKDGNRAYKPGDTYPRVGLRVRQSRIDDLLGKNKGTPVIEEMKPLRKG